MATTKQVQQALLSRGYDLGPGGADGFLGSKTKAALKKFQRDQGMSLKWPGTVGPSTLKALGLTDWSTKDELIVLPEVPWIVYARSFLGLHEVKDAKKLDKALRLDASEIAWCGAFVGMVLGATLTAETLPLNPLGSRNWTKFGYEIDGPQIGAVAVFWRGTKDGWQGHVAFVVGHDATHVHCLGGNQKDSVSIVRVAKNRLLGYYWPINYAQPPITPLKMTSISASITTNEA